MLVVQNKLGTVCDMFEAGVGKIDRERCEMSREPVLGQEGKVDGLGAFNNFYIKKEM